MQLSDLIETVVTGLGYELVEFETSPRARLLRVFIDRSEGATEEKSGIGVEDCAAVSNQLTRVFLVENIDYDRLEVSSPGMDRALTKPSDFRRFSGQDVQLKLRIPLGKQRNFNGTLIGLREVDGIEKLCLRVNDVVHEFSLDNVDRARLVPKF